MASDVDIIIEVATAGLDNLRNLSTGLQQLQRTVAGSVNPIKALDARSRALNQALGGASRTSKDHAKTVLQLARNQAVLSGELKRSTQDLKNLSKIYSITSGASAKFSASATKDLQNYNRVLKSVKGRVLVEDIKAIGLEMKRLGKDAQFTGRSLIIGLTTPIMLAARGGLQSLLAIDKEVVRLNKVLESVAPNADKAAKKLGIDLGNATEQQLQRVDEMVNSYNFLNDSMTKISQKFGVSKSLTMGISADFAELGITVVENITKLTELTAVTEKLGGMDISNAQDLVQSLYFQAVRSLSMTQPLLTAAEREAKAIGAATAQLALFNLVENTTALTLKDLGDAFPEVAAAATSFGLSMTEAAALLAPMKAAGFEIGASANSIKVSLQRVTAPTKQNAEMFKALSQEYNTNFELVKGTGLDAIQALIDSYNELTASAAGAEGGLEFMAKVFGVRQGPRMEVAIQQMAIFDKILKSASDNTNIAEIRIRNLANETIRSLNAANGTTVPLIDSFRSIGIVARIATATAGQEIEGFTKSVTQQQINTAKEARKQIGLQIAQAARDGEDLVAQVSTEAGRAMIVQLAGAANAQDVANRELENSLASLNTQIQIIKNNAKMFAADILQQLAPAFEKIKDISSKLYDAWLKLEPQTRKLFSTLALGFGALTASIGPLIFIFGQARLATGSVVRAMFSLLPGMKTMSVEAVAGASAMMRLKNPLVMIGDTVQNTNGKFATYIATLASGQGPLARFAEKIGLITGRLEKQNTAGFALSRAVESFKQPAGVDALGVGGLPVSSKLITSKLSGKSVKTANNIISPVLSDTAVRLQDALGSSALTLYRRKSKVAVQQFNDAVIVETANILKQQGVDYDNLVKQATLAPGQKMTDSVKKARAVLLPASKQASDLVTEAMKQLSPAGMKKMEKAAVFATRGIELRDDKIPFQGPTKLFKGRELSDRRAEQIARGGVGSSIARTKELFGRNIEKIPGVFNNIGSSIKKISVAPINSVKNGLDAGRKAVQLYNSELSIMGLSSAGKIKNLTTGVLGFAKSFKLVTLYVKLFKLALVGTGIGAILIGISAIVLIIVKNFEEFKEKTKPAMDSLKDAFEAIKRAVMSLIQPFIDFFSSFSKGSGESKNGVDAISGAFNGLAEAVEFIAKVIEFAFSFLGKIIRFFLGSVLGVVRGLIDIVQGIIKIFKGDVAGGLKQVFGGIAKGVYGLLGPFRGVFNFIFDLLIKFVDMAAWAFGWVPGLGDGIKKAARGMKEFKKMLEDSVKMEEAGKKGGKDINDGLNQTTDETEEIIGNAVGEGMEDGAEKGRKAIKEKLKQTAEELGRLILDNVKKAVEGVADSLKGVLSEQKSKYLDIFDQQIETLNKLKKAEESLTKTKEYENRKREIEEERHLNHSNFIRNRALAIYEGRIDDARMLDLEERKSRRESMTQLSDLESSRRQQLADENLQFMTDAINEAKKKASEYFDEAIKSFEENAKKITQFPPRTAEEFQAKLVELENLAKTTADQNGIHFKDMVDQMTNQINTLMPNQTVPVFSTNLGLLVTEAVNKYGLGVTSGDDTTVIGATLSMLAGMAQSIGEDVTVTTEFSNLAGDMKTTLQNMGAELRDVVLPGILTEISTVITANNPFGPEGAWQTSIKTAVETLKETYLDSIFVMKTSLKGLIEQFPELKSQIEELMGLSKKVAKIELKQSGDGAEQKTGGGGSGVTPVQDPFFGLGPLKGEYIRAIVYWTDKAKKDGHIVGNKIKASAKLPDLRWLPLINAYLTHGKTGIFANATKKFFGGKIPSNASYIPGFSSKAVPAVLHGGEFVIKSSSVKKYGLEMLSKINQGVFDASKFTTPKIMKPDIYAPSSSVKTGTVVNKSESIVNYNFYVDNFIGEDAWFESMMKQYNMKVIPRNQKVSGVQNRNISTYNGINRGM